MNNLLAHLCGVLRAESKEGKELIKLFTLQELSLSGKTGISTVSSSGNSTVENFQDLVNSSRDHTSKLLDLEDERTRVLLTLSSKLKIPCEELTISKLEELHSSHSQELRKLKSELTEIFQKLMRLSQTSKYLISRSLSFVEDRIRVINYAVDSMNTYKKNGKREHTKAFTLVDKEI